MGSLMQENNMQQKSDLSFQNKPKVTKLHWNIVDPPWNFYSIVYEINNYSEHMVYIPLAVVEEELKTKTIVEIILEKLNAELDCDPVHIDRITEEMKNETRKRAKAATRSRSES